MTHADLMSVLLAFDYDEAGRREHDLEEYTDDEQARGALVEQLGPRADGLGATLWQVLADGDHRVVELDWLVRLMCDAHDDVPVSLIVDAIRSLDAPDGDDFPLAYPAYQLLETLTWQRRALSGALNKYVAGDPRLSVALTAALASHGEKPKRARRTQLFEAAIEACGKTESDTWAILSDAGFDEHEVRAAMKDQLLAADKPHITNLRIILKHISHEEARSVMSRARGEGLAANHAWAIFERDDTVDQTLELFRCASDRLRGTPGHGLFANMAAALAERYLESNRSVPREVVSHLEAAPAAAKHRAQALLARL